MTHLKKKKLQSAKGLEGASLCDACSQERKWEYKSLAYTSLVRPILDYGAACWDPCRGQINVLDRVQKKAAQYTYHTKDCRKIARLCLLFNLLELELVF